SAIGFNCRLFATTQKGDAESLRMAERDSINIRVINASWLNTIYYDFFFNSTAPFTSKGLYNEINEQGVVMVAAAVHARLSLEKHARSYIFPHHMTIIFRSLV